MKKTVMGTFGAGRPAMKVGKQVVSGATKALMGKKVPSAPSGIHATYNPQAGIPKAKKPITIIKPSRK